MDPSPDAVEGEDLGDRQAGPLEVFHPGVSKDIQASTLVVAEALRCQVKISTHQNLHLRIANHTARDVYVRLVGHGGRVAEIKSGLPVKTLEQSVAAARDSVPLSPLDPAATAVEPEKQQGSDRGNADRDKEQQPGRVSTETSSLRPQSPRAEDKAEEDEEESGPLTISELTYSPCASTVPTPVEDSQGGVDSIFSSPVHSPARLLRELHADPDIQAQLEAERERERAYERARRAGGGGVGAILSDGLRLLSHNQRVNACVLSAARLLAAVTGVLLVTVPTLLLLLESDIDVSFLHEIRQTPEFEQFHYEYYCPLRRWILCRLSVAMEHLWSD